MSHRTYEGSIVDSRVVTLLSKFHNDEAMRRGGNEGGKNNKEKKWIESDDDESCPRMLGMRLITDSVNFVIHRSIDSVVQSRLYFSFRSSQTRVSLIAV